RRHTRFSRDWSSDVCSSDLHVRHSVDDSLRTTQPVKLSKPYPLGQCLEISLAVEKALKTLDPAALPDNAVAGYRALAAFFNAGRSEERRVGKEGRCRWGAGG